MASFPHRNALERQVLRFAATGALAGGTHLATLALCIHLVGLSSALAGAVSFIAAISVAYTLQALWVFPGTRLGARLPRYAVLVAIGMAINGAAIHVSADILSAGWLPGWAAASAIVPAANFVAGRFWVFA